MPGTGTFRIALIQTSCALDPNENLAKAEWKIREAAANGGQIICLQELFRSQYFCREENHDLFALAEAIPGPSTQTLGKLAHELGVVIIASLFERRGAGVYHNTAAVLGTDGEVAGIHRKMHIPDDPLYYEKFYFTPGDVPPAGEVDRPHLAHQHRQVVVAVPLAPDPLEQLSSSEGAVRLGEQDGEQRGCVDDHLGSPCSSYSASLSSHSDGAPGSWRRSAAKAPPS